MLPPEHPVKEGLVNITKELMQEEPDSETLGTDGLAKIRALEFVEKAGLESGGGEDGSARIRVDVDDVWYYRMLSELAGVEIAGEYQLISMVKELSALKTEYEQAREALASVRNTGYGVITPRQNEIRMEEPVVIRQGNKFGVKLKAVSPSIHLIRAEIETEISPIVGSEQQAQDLIAYIRESAQNGDGIWDTNIFGKSIEQMTEDGIRGKLSQITEEGRQKLQQVMQRIVNENSGGFICIII
ncbi:putative stage IV sporulation protein A [Marvinbryantia formatexigens DSM 14469]|uniref:Stage IV sporulation protein A n=2 Tax=Marvinbryantia TaxID=248744 RepID=C6LEP6_9FIRM|nr:putative stage IV sporulation protein A [Marvinbryantia formatexigens DSM 14469]